MSVELDKPKNNFFSNLNTNVVTENKTFCKNLKPFLTDKVKIKSKITLIKKIQG